MPEVLSESSGRKNCAEACLKVLLASIVTESAEQEVLIAEVA